MSESRLCSSFVSGVDLTVISSTNDFANSSGVIINLSNLN